MPRFRPLVLTFLLLCLLAGPFSPAAARAQASAPVPPGFRAIDSAPGVQLYRKDYKDGAPDFVQVADLSQGAAVEVLHGEITARRPDRGMFGGPDPRLRSRSLADYWEEIKSQFRSAFCVTNGQFFYMVEYPTRLPYPLKKDGEIVADGYDEKHHLGERLMLELWGDRADIQPLSGEALHASSAPDIIGGLTEEANKRAKYRVGRTFMGVADFNGDGAFESVLLFTTTSARQSDAAKVLRDFGAAKVMMLDGGGSTQLMCGKKTYIESERLIPQAVAVIAAPEGGAPVQPTPIMAAVEPAPAPENPEPAQDPAPTELAALPPTEPPAPAPTQDPAAANPPPQPTPAPTQLAAIIEPLLEPTPASLWLGRAGGFISLDRNAVLNRLRSANGLQYLPLVHAERALPGEPAPPDEVQALALDPALPPDTGQQSAPPVSAAAPPEQDLQVDLSGVLLVPLSMLPVLGALFFAISKIQRRVY